jgi:hypothetical protein
MEGAAEQPPPVARNFQPNNELERMLMAATSDPKQRPAFQQLLLQSDLLAATPTAPAVAGPRTFGAGEEIPLLTVPAPDDGSVAAIFTSEPRLVEAFGAGTGYVEMSGQALLELVAKTGAFLNPASAYRVHWDPTGIAGVLDAQPCGLSPNRPN